MPCSNSFSDGAIALKLKEERNIPYVVSVRATDVDIYSKWMCHLWSMGRKIIKAAERVIFISPTIQDALLKSKPFSGMHEEIRNKSVIIPNGIDEVWLENIRSERPKININAPRIIYVGVLDKNKNVLRLMDAVDSLSKKYPGIKLSIVGGNGSTEDIIRKRCIDNPNRYQMLGKIYDKDKLQRLMCQHDIFAMVSLCETFGLVYVEAMSQGLPILYSQGRGIDGIFEEKVGEAVKPDEKISIVEGLERMILHYDEYAVMGDKLQRFSWPMLAKEYVKIYKDFI